MHGGGCGERPFHGVLLLGGEARLRDPHELTLPTRSSGHVIRGSPGVSVALARNLPFEDLGSGIYGHLGPVQVMRLDLHASHCLPPSRAANEGAFAGSFASLQGRLEGAPHHPSFSPLGLAPVRQTQSWPLLGSLPDGTGSLGEFRFGRWLPGSWARASRSYVRLDVGGLDAKASVDFSRPAVARDTELTWIETTPFAAVARVTNLDNQAKWQTLVLAATIWFGIGGSVVAALIFEQMRPRHVRPAPATSAATTGEPLRPATAPELLTVVLLTLVRGRRRNRR